MQCAKCSNTAIIENPYRCKEHFIHEFEYKVEKTIHEHSLLFKTDRVAVAVSGGKDSLTVLVLLKKWGYKVTAIAIDEGIAGYREKTLADAEKICNQHNIPLIIKSYKEFTGLTLDEMMKHKKFHPCAVCGTLRRHLLNVAAREFDVLVTGHNADDECQAILMNVIKGNTELFARLGPVSGNGALGLVKTPGFQSQDSMNPRFTRRVKPLYFCTEKEVMTYAFLHGLVDEYVECPNTNESYRQIMRDELNSYAQSHPGVKERLLKNFLNMKNQLKTEEHAKLQPCTSCGEPASKSPCGACRYIEMMKHT